MEPIEVLHMNGMEVNESMTPMKKNADWQMIIIIDYILKFMGENTDKSSALNNE